MTTEFDGDAVIRISGRKVSDLSAESTARWAGGKTIHRKDGTLKGISILVGDPDLYVIARVGEWIVDVDGTPHVWTHEQFLRNTTDFENSIKKWRSATPR